MAKSEDFNPSEIIAQYNEMYNATQALRDRFENSISLYTLQKHKESEKEGEYENVTTNRPAIFGRKVVAILTEGKPSYSMEIEGKSEAQRDAISMTERYAYYAIEQANARLRKLLLPTIHQQASFYAPIRGVCVPRGFVRPDKDGQPIIDVQFFDPLNVCWWMGEDGLIQVCAKRWITQNEAKLRYPDANPPTSLTGNDKVEVYDFINTEFERPIIGGDWAKPAYNHKLGRVPVNLIGNTNSPPIMSDELTDTIQYQWEDVYSNNRDLYPIASQLFTYYQTTVANGVVPPFAVEWDSTKSNGVPPSIEAYPGNKKAVNYIDVGKGQKLIPPVTQAMPRDAFALWQIIDAQLSMGELSKISYGQADSNTPAAAISMLLEADSQLIKPFKQTVEACEQWIVNEIIQQTKSGEYKEIEARGRDAKNQPYSAKVKAKELVDDQPIKCEVVMDNTRQELQKVGIMLELYKSGIASAQTVRDNLPSLFPDTDAEKETVDREQAEKFPNIQARQWLNAFLEDKKGIKGNEAIVQALTEYIAILDAKLKPPAPPTLEGQPFGGAQGKPTQGMGEINGVPTGPQPTAVVGAEQAAPGMEVPPEIMAAMQGQG